MTAETEIRVDSRMRTRILTDTTVKPARESSRDPAGYHVSVILGPGRRSIGLDTWCPAIRQR